MKYLWVLLLFILFIPLVIGSNHTPEDEIFSKVSEAINPPLAPGAPTPQTIGTDVDGPITEYPVVLGLIDATTNHPIKNVHVLIELNNDISYRTLQYVGESGNIELSLPPSSYTLVLKVDDITTTGGDYYASADLQLLKPTNATIRLLPTGSVRGKVIKRDMLIRNARVSFTCSGLYGDMQPIDTDEFGSFTSQWLPPGTCIIRATDGSEVGSREVVVVSGTLQDITLELETRLSSTSLFFYMLLLLIIIIALITQGRPSPQNGLINIG